MQTKFSIRVFCFLAVGATATTGALFKPGPWYAALIKPAWTPPNLVFPIAWTILYLIITVVGVLIFEGSSRILKQLWVLQLALNGCWSWLFFGQHWMLLGMLDMVLLLATIARLVASAFSRIRAVAWLLVPYLAWVGYASTLNLGIYLMNSH